VAIGVAITLSALGFTLISGDKPTGVTTVTEQQMSAKPDMVKLKAEIQALESSWAAIWEKRNGKFICVRDIYNDDVKEK